MPDQRSWKIPRTDQPPGPPGRPFEEPAEREITLDGSELDKLLTRRFEVYARNRPRVYRTFATRKEAEQFFADEHFDPDRVVINEVNSLEVKHSRELTLQRHLSHTYG